jgi:hypothetical protein
MKLTTPLMISAGVLGGNPGVWGQGDFEKDERQWGLLVSPLRCGEASET